MYKVWERYLGTWFYLTEFDALHDARAFVEACEREHILREYRIEAN